MFPKTLGNYYFLCFIDGGVKVHKGEMTSMRQTRFRHKDSTPVTYVFSTGQHTVCHFHRAAHSVPFPQCSTQCAFSTVQHTVCLFHSAAHSVQFPPYSTQCAFSTVQHTVCLFHSAAHSVPFPQCSTQCVISKGQQQSIQQRSRLLPFSQVS